MDCRRPVSIPGGFSGSLRRLALSVVPELPHHVSIPGGFSGSLRPDHPASGKEDQGSFNPWRVFWLVATCCKEEDPAKQIMFQSLAGFLARCDCIGGAVDCDDISVSIPGGFSGSLRPNALVLMVRAASSFNPWRVFWLVAT